MNELKKLRKEKNIKQSSIAKEVGVTQQAFSCYELGLMKPSLDIAKKIADIFDCSIEEIFFNRSHK